MTLLIALVPLFLMGSYFLYHNWANARKNARTVLAFQTRLLETEITGHFLRPWLDELRFSQIEEKRPGGEKVPAVFSQILRISMKSEGPSPNSFKVKVIYDAEQKDHLRIPENFLRTFLDNPSWKSRSIWISPVYHSGTDQTGYFLLTGNRLRHPEKSSVDVAVIPVSSLLNRLKTVVSSDWKKYRFGIIDADRQYFILSGTGLTSAELQELRQHWPTLAEGGNSENNLARQRIEKGWFTQLEQVEDLPLWVFGQIPKPEMFASFLGINLEFFIFLLFGILAAFLGAWYFAKKITVPLQHFAKSATEIARGDFTQKIEINSNDEIGRLARIFNYMMVELRRLNEMNLNQIISERAKTRAVIKNITDGVIVTDPRGNIMMINAAVEEWFQIEESRVLERPLDKVLPNEHLENLIQDMRQEPGFRTYAREISIRLPGKRKESYFQAHSGWVYDQDRRRIAAVTIFRDITREKEVDRMKTELVSLVAHELRSPLTSISGFAELLLDTPLNDNSIYEYSKIIKQESDRLSDLVNKFLDLTRIEAGKMDFRPQPLQLRELIEGILYIASSHAQTKNIILDVKLQDEMDPVLADSKLMSEVVLNLLSNAIKYSPRDTTIKLTLREEADSVILEVSDQGYGIPEKHLGRIFDKFFRVKDEAAQEERGTGLGLSLVKEIVELHKGIIKVESTIGNGSVFRVILPRQRSIQSGDGNGEAHDRMAHSVIQE
ncbi:alkaline phosphatase synthesis sensor protein PhoR [bacterium BMS3Bbin03]|nr:alkaline phosphatase synthesis sensor protein PhoR [bacterium BMS3Bbin03]